MRLTCPHCGERDVREFEYLGSAELLNRPTGENSEAFHQYVYLRNNPHGENTELWQHVMGCRAWLHAIRNVTTHKIIDVKLVSEVKEAIK